MSDLIQKKISDAVAGAFSETTVRWTKDAYGNVYGWTKFCEPLSLESLAPRLAALGMRLMAITAYRTDKYARVEGREIAYHFDLDGVTLTVGVYVDEEPPRVPSLARWFHNADWNEREFMELYGIIVDGHPNPRRLFLDKDIDSGQLDRLIPLSTMMDGASTKTLWEKIFSGTGMPEWAKEAK